MYLFMSLFPFVSFLVDMHALAENRVSSGSFLPSHRSCGFLGGQPGGTDG